MAQITLTAQARKVLGKQNNNIRRAGKLPAVLYGHGQSTQSIEIDERDFKKAFKQAGENTILALNVEGKDVPVLIHDVQHHYLKGQPIHVDFYAVNMTEKLTAGIPIHFNGEAPAVKALGGILVKNLSEIEVECLPGDLPHSIDVDISVLNTFEDVIRVSDLKISDKVKILAQPDEMIANVAPPRTEEELKSLEEKPVEADVTKVEGVVKPDAEAEASAEGPDKDKKEKPEKKEKE